jgi:hypothetical protein
MSGFNLRAFKPEGGESWEDVLKRATEVLNELIINYVKKDYEFEYIVPKKEIDKRIMTDNSKDER